MKEKLQIKVEECYNELELYKYKIASVEEITEDIIEEMRTRVRDVPRESIIIFLVGIAMYDWKTFKSYILRSNLKRMALELEASHI